MPDDRVDRPSGTSVAVEITDPRLRDRITAACRELPDLELDKRGHPDASIVILTDRFEAMRHASPDTAVIVLTDRAHAWAMLRAGAAGVLPRSAGPEELRLAIDAVLHGLVVAPAGSPRPTEEEPEGRLTAREGEVLKLLAEGASNKMIARRLAVSVHTVKFHVASILEKLDATGRTDAVAHAVRLGMLML
jgi:DNA-binding NarL/FixJ family response regulator